MTNKESMFANKRDVYIETSSGDSFLVEIEENHGWVVVTVGNQRVDLEPDSVFDIIDALTMVANGVTSHVGGGL